MNLEIYGKADCVFCNRAKQVCDTNQLPYTYYDIAEDPARKVEFDTRTGGAQTVPQIFIGMTLVGGFDDFIRQLKSGVIQQLLAGE